MKYTYRFPLFRAMDADAVERYLTRKAAKGLQLESAGSFLWKFRRTKSAALTYAVTYFPQASAYGGPMTPEQQELADYCAAAGWNYVTQWLRMQIYVTDRPDPVPLETDEAQKLNLIQEVFRKNLPYELLLLAALSFQILLQIHNISETLTWFPTQLLSSSNLVSMAVLLLLGVLIIFLMATELLRMTCWLFRAKRCLERGYPCPPSSRRLLQVLWAGINVVIPLFLVWVLLRLLFSGSPAQILKLVVPWLIVRKDRLKTVE